MPLLFLEVQTFNVQDLVFLTLMLSVLPTGKDWLRKCAPHRRASTTPAISSLSGYVHSFRFYGCRKILLNNAHTSGLTDDAGESNSAEVR